MEYNLIYKMRRCAKCNELKGPEEFYSRKVYPSSYCKKCERGRYVKLDDTANVTKLLFYLKERQTK
jgi:hypothetical protein